MTTPKPLTVWLTANFGKFFKRWDTRPPYLPPEKLYAGEEAPVRTRLGKMDWFQIGKGVHQGCILSVYLTFMQSASYEMPGWMKLKLESRLLGEISITSDTQMPAS